MKSSPKSSYLAHYGLQDGHDEHLVRMSILRGLSVKLRGLLHLSSYEHAPCHTVYGNEKIQTDNNQTNSDPLHN